MLIIKIKMKFLIAKMYLKGGEITRKSIILLS